MFKNFAPVFLLGDNSAATVWDVRPDHCLSDLDVLQRLSQVCVGFVTVNKLTVISDYLGLQWKQEELISWS